MSVLTINNTVPDRAFALPERHLRSTPLTLPPTQALPALPVELPAEYTRSVAKKAQPGAANTHRHSRTVSSSTLPLNPLVAKSNFNPPHRHSFVPPTSTPSTPSRPSSASPANMQRQGTTGSNSNASLPRRSTSNRSVATNSPTSYVTLMRKQKATVWCDRSQAIDARLAAQQRAAKQRAVLEVVGTASQRTSTISSGGVVGKIRHVAASKTGQYTPQNMSGAGVPMRLLANDMADEDEVEGRVTGDNRMAHARNNSGKSSINSGKYRSGYPRVHHSPPEGSSPAHENIPEAGETPNAELHRNNYFEQGKKSMGSDSEDSFGEFKELGAPNSKLQALEQKAREDDLRRRGSVDERTTTMRSTGKLFIANPDP